MDEARETIGRTLAELKTLLAQETVPHFSEADTKAYFIEPVIAALGWVGIGVVTREYYVKNSQEFIDYVLFASSDSGTGQLPVLAIETKALQVDLTEKHAAQLIQYCAVEGIEWAALTNARELQFFNTFLKPDLAAKRVMRLDLLAFNSDEEFDILYEQLWQLSQESITTSSVRTWLNQLRLDKAVRETVLNPASPMIKQLGNVLADAEVRATPQELVQWFRTHLAPPVTRLQARSSGANDPVRLSPTPPATITSIPTREVRPFYSDPQSLLAALQRAVNERFPSTEWRTTTSYIAAADKSQIFMPVMIRTRSNSLVIGLDLPPSTLSPRLVDDVNRFSWERFRKVATLRTLEEIDDEILSLIEASHSHAKSGRTVSYYGVTLAQLVQAGVLPPDTMLAFVARGRDLARARVNTAGEIIWQGQHFRNLSDRAFAALLGPGRASVNGWSQWYAEFPAGRVKLADLRATYLSQLTAAESRTESVS